MHYIDEWSNLHGLEKAITQDILSGIRLGVLPQKPRSHVVNIRQKNASLVLASQQVCFDLYIEPAFRWFFRSAENVGDALTKIEFHNNLDGARPHTRDNGPKTNPVVIMAWENRNDDLICLAHETAHAVQINLSDHAFMPPIAREVCAFLGELLFLDWCCEHNEALFLHLSDTWLKDNTRYLDEYAENLAAEIPATKSPYRYWMNYPLARVMAVYLFEHSTSAQIHHLFSSGSNAMSHLPFQRLARASVESAYYQMDTQGTFHMLDSGSGETIKQKELLL